MNDKQLLQMIERLGRNSRIARSSKSFAASDVISVEGEKMKDRDDQVCAATLRKIIGNSNSNSNSDYNRRSFAAADTAAIPSSNRNVNKVSVLTQFILRNGKI